MDHQAFAQLLGNYGEFVGAIAVVGTLVYLALQVRHSKEAMNANTRSLDESRRLTRETMLLQLVARWDSSFVQTGENREIASIVVRGNENPEELDAVDRHVYESRIGQLFDGYFMFHRMTESGFLDPAIIEFSDRTLREYWADNKGARDYWEKNRNLWPDSLRARIDGLLEDAGPTDH